MRIPKAFGKRSTADEKELEPKVKYFLAFEGEETEPQYFFGVLQNKNVLGIHALVEIVPLKRHYEERAWSHPCKFIGPLIRSMKEYSSGKKSIKTLINHSVDHMIKSPINDCKDDAPRKISERLHATLLEHGYGCEEIPDNEDTVLTIICNCLHEMYPTECVEKSIDSLQHYINEQALFYNADVDKVCLIIDRDAQNFKLNQYDALLAACDKKGFSLHVSNPCFEIWLLMHYPDILEYDRTILYENRKASGDKRFLEVELRKLLPGFKKSSLPFNELVDKVDRAILNEQHFCEDLTELKTNLGSNVGLLIKELKK
jgi:hypothetical protein